MSSAGESPAPSDDAMSVATFAADLRNASGGGWTRAAAAHEYSSLSSAYSAAAAATTAAASELPFDGPAVAVAVVSGACALAGSALNLLLGAAVILTARRRRRNGYRRRLSRFCGWGGGLGPADVYVASIAGADLLQSCVYLPCVAVGNAYRTDLFGSGGCFLLTWLQATCVGVIWASHCAMALHWAALTFVADARLLRWRGRVAAAAAVAVSWAAMTALSAASSSRDARFTGTPNYHCSAEYRTPYQLALMAARLALPVLLAPVAYIVAFVRIVRFKAVVRQLCRPSSGGGHPEGRQDGGAAESGRGAGAFSVVERDCCSDSNGSGGATTGSCAESGGTTGICAESGGTTGICAESGGATGSCAESGSGEARGDGVRGGVAAGRRPAASKELRMLRSTIVMFVVFSVLYTLSTIARLATTSSVGVVTAGHCVLFVTSVVNAPMLLSINRDYGRALSRMLCGKNAELR